MALAAAQRTVSSSADLSHSMRVGASWGVVAAAVMAMYAMFAGLTYLGSGFFTPLYHIAASVIGPTELTTSMQRAMEGQTNFHFAAFPAAAGMIVHLAVGAIYGIAFALLARRLQPSGVTAVLAGGVFGIAVMLFSSFALLPITATVLGGSDPISDMPTMVGWTTFTIEHLLFGSMVGLGWAASMRSVRTEH